MPRQGATVAPGATRSRTRVVARTAMSLFVSSTLLTGCAPGQFSTQASRIGPDDGTDSCRPYLVALDSTGNYFGADILTGAAAGAAGGAALGAIFGQNLRSALIGAAAGAATGAAAGYWVALQKQSQDQAVLASRVSSDISRDNVQIDKTQEAFNQLTDCRVRQANAIREAYQAHRIDRPTAVAQLLVVKQHAMHDAEVGQKIEGQIQDRSAQFQDAADHLSPGTSTAVATADTPPPSRPATVARAAPLKLRPDPGAPDVTSLAPGDKVTVTRARGSYALVETGSGERGYTPFADLAGPGANASAQAAPQVIGGGDVRTLAGSNAARRDQFAESVAVSRQEAATGFDLSG